ncbi:DBH-like monooxygenase protein 1 [Pocillopora verrucosa]|uniref:DBH-like monooxygenase protein 1 n=1 Tax=Pocillopora verrucosa TaxID=203993 RepID=UPI0033413CB0
MFSLVLIAISALVPANGADLSAEFAHEAVLDTYEKMKLFWTVNWENKTVSFAVEAATTGWVGFGISSGNGNMAGSDMVIGWVKDSKGYLTDRFADAQSCPPLDKENNYNFTGFEESEGKTVLRFCRKFDTCDPRDRKIEEGTTKVVFAYHAEDPTSEDDMKKHTFRGAKSILLLNNMDKKQVNETGWQQFYVTNRNVTIPKERTTYWCSLIQLPEFKSKHHITKFEPYVTPGNEGIVHHLIVYECHGNFSNASLYGSGFDCSVPNMPLRSCYDYSVVAVWAVGGTAFYYPPKAGYPVDTNSPRTFFLELHYDNPNAIEGRKDSSGIRFYYTSHLREYDAGIMCVGERISKFAIIPPKQESWLTVGYCPKECYLEDLQATKLPEKGIKVFAALLHTHLQGRATWTKHVRNGVELPEIARDDHYDFNFQDIQVLREEAHIKPEDDLIHFCKYETMDRDTLVQAGFSTTQEMCLNYMFYYPRMVNATAYCSSSLRKPVYDFIKERFPSLKESKWSNPLIGANISWTKELVSDLRKRFDEAETFLPYCRARPNNYTYPIPKITKPLPPRQSNCRIRSTTPAPPVGDAFLVKTSYSTAISLLISYFVFM